MEMARVTLITTTMNCEKRRRKKKRATQIPQKEPLPKRDLSRLLAKREDIMGKVIAHVQESAALIIV